MAYVFKSSSSNSNSKGGPAVTVVDGYGNTSPTEASSINNATDLNNRLTIVENKVTFDKGYFETTAELLAALTTGIGGDYALNGETDTTWVWDTTTNAWIDSQKPFPEFTQQQSRWSQTDSTQDDYIIDKPIIVNKVTNTPDVLADSAAIVTYVSAIARALTLRYYKEDSTGGYINATDGTPVYKAFVDPAEERFEIYTSLYLDNKQANTIDQGTTITDDSIILATKQSVSEQINTSTPSIEDNYKGDPNNDDGAFTNSSDLIAAYQIGEDGWYAFVAPSNPSDNPTVWVWVSEDSTGQPINAWQSTDSSLTPSAPALDSALTYRGSLPANANLNTYLKFGSYSVAGGIATTVINGPSIKKAGMFISLVSPDAYYGTQIYFEQDGVVPQMWQRQLTASYTFKSSSGRSYTSWVKQASVTGYLTTGTICTFDDYGNLNSSNKKISDLTDETDNLQQQVSYLQSEQDLIASRIFKIDSYIMVDGDNGKEFTFLISSSKTVTLPNITEDGQKIFIQNSPLSNTDLVNPANNAILTIETPDGAAVLSNDLITPANSLNPNRSSTYISYLDTKQWIAE